MPRSTADCTTWNGTPSCSKVFDTSPASSASVATSFVLPEQISSCSSRPCFRTPAIRGSSSRTAAREPSTRATVSSMKLHSPARGHCTCALSRSGWRYSFPSDTP
eukprot:1212745-Pyramimonas_sp.AAC.2